jgi:hypothetical protein
MMIALMIDLALLVFLCMSFGIMGFIAYCVLAIALKG